MFYWKVLQGNLWKRIDCLKLSGGSEMIKAPMTRPAPQEPRYLKITPDELYRIQWHVGNWISDCGNVRSRPAPSPYAQTLYRILKEVDNTHDTIFREISTGINGDDPDGEIIDEEFGKLKATLRQKQQEQQK